MPLPSREEFRSLAHRYSVVPVWQEWVADTLTPVAAYLIAVGDSPGFLFESVEGGERWGRFSFVGREPTAVYSSHGRTVEVEADGKKTACGTDGILSVLSELLENYRTPDVGELPPLHSGLVGYLGYDVVREIEKLPNPPPDDLGFPDALLYMIGDLAVFDHLRQSVTVLHDVLVPKEADDKTIDDLYEAAVDSVDRMTKDIFGGVPRQEPSVPSRSGSPLLDVRRTLSTNEYAQAVKVAKEYIQDGEIFQVVLSQRFDLDLGADPFDLYRVLRQLNPSPYMYFMRHSEICLVGSSPEPMVRLRNGKVISRPIAGTRRRGATELEDKKLEAELREHPKEIAEHVMLVDLARNDVGRVVEYGTETVDELMTLERYSHVMHLTSQVSGELAVGKGPIDVLRATLPAGTVSGAPKVRAMEIIDELEHTKRGPYAGVVGYLDFSGNIDTAIAIRTMFVKPDGSASVQAGAGIVADSDEEAEDLECANKAAALLSAVPVARAMTAQREHGRSSIMDLNAYSSDASSSSAHSTKARSTKARSTK